MIKPARAEHFYAKRRAKSMVFKINQIPIATRQSRFVGLATEASRCTLCPSMCGRAAVLSELNGPVDARLLVQLYHPSPQVLITSRDEKTQLKDYEVVARAIRQIYRP